jgi:hypothetical protein
MRTMAAAIDHLKMTTWNVIVVISLLVLLLLASLLLTWPGSQTNAAADPAAETRGSLLIQGATGPAQALDLAAVERF